MSPRRYRITVKGQSYDVEVGDLSASPVTVIVDGVEYEVDLPDGETGAAQPSPRPKAPSTRRPAEPRRPSAPPRPSVPATGGNVIRAMMPGRVLAVNVQAGDAVHRGQAVLVMESMKMEQTVAATSDGVVSAVHVSVGATVQHGQTLIELG
ncbi:MAG: biotin/lipoyl-containing protein [Dehalococcoidia bacterium]